LKLAEQLENSAIAELEHLLPDRVCTDLMSDNLGQLSTNVTCLSFSVCSVIRQLSLDAEDANVKRSVTKC
jgi:hypothetical protein